MAKAIPKCEVCGDEKKTAYNSQGHTFWTCYKCRKRRERQRRALNEKRINYEDILGLEECPGCGDMSRDAGGVCLGECKCYVPTAERIEAHQKFYRENGGTVTEPKTNSGRGIREYHGERVSATLKFTEVR